MVTLLLITDVVKLNCFQQPGIILNRCCYCCPLLSLSSPLLPCFLSYDVIKVCLFIHIVVQLQYSSFFRLMDTTTSSRATRREPPPTETHHDTATKKQRTEKKHKSDVINSGNDSREEWPTSVVKQLNGNGILSINQIISNAVHHLPSLFHRSLLVCMSCLPFPNSNHSNTNTIQSKVTIRSPMYRINQS
jgi:hypothetical protein